MNEAFVTAEPMIRLASFAAVLAVMIAWETLLPRRRRLVSRWLRWPSNIGIAVLNTLLLRVVFPAAATGFALLAAERGWGLFNLLENEAQLAFLDKEGCAIMQGTYFSEPMQADAMIDYIDGFKVGTLKQANI